MPLRLLAAMQQRKYIVFKVQDCYQIIEILD